tara:strand:+ start:2906 stop:3412 length:507 start_codon:yes stop_codon:yes gene_type:complete
MAKKKEVSAEPTVEAPVTFVEPAPEATTTLSTRLTAEQKDLIEQAARLQSWTSSNLMRKAAVERAAQIVNTGRPSRFEFGVLAERLASQLCDPDLWVEREEEREIIQWGIYDDGKEVKVTSLAPFELNQLRDALHLGGVEFMEQVVDACQRKLSDVELPEPIDFNTLY